MAKYYTGIGSRSTPYELLMMMSNLAKILGNQDYVLRSGGAVGADTAFEDGARSVLASADIYLPWYNFNHRSYTQDNIHAKVCINKDAEDIASKYHPKWSSLSSGAKKLHTRNVYQVLGDDLSTPSDFIICYTPGGTGSGGTGQALRIAKGYGIPVFDCGMYSDLSECMDKLLEFININGRWDNEY